MPFLDFDARNIHLQIKIGALEEYKPSKKMKMLVDRIEKLRSEAEDFRDTYILPEIEAIQKIVEQENNKVKKNVKDEPKKEKVKV